MMCWATVRACVILIILALLSVGVCGVGSDPIGEQAPDKDFAIEASVQLAGVPRVNSAENSSGLRINTDRGDSVLVRGGVTALLVTEPELTLSMVGEGAKGDPGSGWTYDILVSDQAWNMYNDGFQSMEVDPNSGEDTYVVYESWTNYATGTNQWCLAMRRTLNGGETWSPEIWVFAYTTPINGVYPDMKEPDIAIDNGGTLWLTYTVFAYDGPSRNIADMQVDVQYMSTSAWGSGPWTWEPVTDMYGGAYNYHRLPTVAIDQITDTPVICAVSYDAVPSSSYSSLVAWQPGATEWDGYEVLPDGPDYANYVQHPCMDTGSDYMYVTVMYYYAPGGVFDMVVYRSTDGGQVWALVGDFYDAANVNSFYKPSIASTKSGIDYVVCAGTYTPDPSDQSYGDIGYAFSVDSCDSWNEDSGYLLPMANYQRMPYVQEYGNENFIISYRQEDGGPTYSTMVMYADTSDLTYWEGFEVASDTGAWQASNWFAHVGIQERPDGMAYICLCWSDLRDAATPISETSDTYVVYSTYGARYTIDTDPTGLEVLVDSQTYTAPQLFNWPAGYTHQVEAPDPQTGGGGETYNWVEWSDGGDYLHDILIDMTDTTLVAHYTSEYIYVIELEEGWNLVSFPLTQDDESVLTVLSSIAGQWDYVMAYNATQADHWKTYSPDKPPQLNDLADLDHMMGFWIYINQPFANLTVIGQQPTTTLIPLYAGWNLVGYPSGTPRQAHLTLPIGVDMVAVHDDGQPYLVRDEIILPNVWLQAGEGYWIHVNFDTTWVVDW